MRPVISSRGRVLVSFGRHRGEELLHLPDSYLQWMAATLQQEQCSIWGALAQQELDHRGSKGEDSSTTTLVDVLERWSAEKKLDINSYGFLLRQARSLREGQRIVAHILRRGLDKYTFLRNVMMDMYKRCGQPEASVHVFRKQMERKNHFSWNIFMSALLQLDRGSERAKQAYDRMPMWDAVSTNIMIAAFAQAGDLEQAARLFEGGGAGRDRVSWNAIIAAYSRSSSTCRRALELFGLMDAEGVYHPPDVFTLVSAFEACSLSPSPSLFFGKELHRELAELGITDVAVGNSVVTMYGAWGSDSAKSVFDAWSGRDVVTWNAMLTAFARSDDLEAAEQVWEKMASHNLVSWNAIIAVWSRLGDLEAALYVFEWMPERDLVSWNAILSACVHNGGNDEALQLWDRMQQQPDVKADKVTLTTLLDACANLRLHALGESLVRSFKCSDTSDLVVANAMMSFHVKCGNVSDAKAVFERIKDRDVVSWSSMVSALHHDVSEALELLRLMLLDGVAPNKVTSIAVLSVCSHAGALDAACWIFQGLESDYGTRLLPDHYICMIDLLGRAGEFDRGQELVHSAPFDDADNLARRTLIAAYLQHSFAA